MGYLICFAVGYVSSALLYTPTHSKTFPETGRYAVGICSVASAMIAIGVPKEEVERFLIVSGFVGAGVVIARLTK